MSIAADIYAAAARAVDLALTDSDEDPAAVLRALTAIAAGRLAQTAGADQAGVVLGNLRKALAPVN